MRPVPNDIVSTLIRYLPQILENVQIDSGNTRLINAVRLTKRIIPRLKKIENEKNTNPNGNKFVLPKGYTDLGWQLDFNASELKNVGKPGISGGSSIIPNTCIGVTMWYISAINARMYTMSI